MDNFPINPADAVVFTVLLLSALLAFTRGMVAEVLSLAAWAGAALTSLYTLPFALPVVQNYVKVEMVAYVITSAGLFTVSLVILTILFGRISRGVQNSSLSAVDRSLGFLFGLFKGGVLLSVAYLFFTWLVPAPEQPQWLQQAKTRPMMIAGAGLIYEFVPANLRADGLNQIDLTRDRARQAMEAKEALDRLTSPVPAGGKTGAPPANTGYKGSDRGEIDRLIQNTR